jgi:hypothetical protein
MTREKGGGERFKGRKREKAGVGEVGERKEADRSTLTRKGARAAARDLLGEEKK